MIRPDVPYVADGTLKSKNYDSSGCALCGWQDDKLQELTAFQVKDLYSLTTTPRLLSLEKRGADAKRANELSYNGPRLRYSSTFVISRAAAGTPSHLRHLSSRRRHYSAYVTLLSLSYAVVSNLFTQSASSTYICVPNRSVTNGGSERIPVSMDVYKHSTPTIPLKLCVQLMCVIKPLYSLLT